MTIELKVDASRLVARLDKIGPDVRQALVDALNPLAQAIAAAARGIAAAHIRYLGRLGPPGAYLASIYGGVSEKPGSVIGFVRTGNALANFLDGKPTGADPFTIGPHDIFAKPGDVLAFGGDAGTVFAKVVRSPGAQVPRYPAVRPAFAAESDTVERTVEDAVDGVLNR